MRFQVFFSADYKWPDFDNKIFFLWPNQYVDKPSANIDGGMIFGNGVFCPTLNENYNDALAFRVGSNSGNFKTWPADANADGYAEHPEYCLGNGYGNNSPDVSQTDPPDDTPHPGTLFRFRKGEWYTIEFRYKLGTEGQENGTMEAWVDGTKVYSDTDLETCGDGTGSCAAVDEFAQYFWYNFFQEGGGLQGYGLADNIVISKAYIGPPSTGTVSPITYYVAKTGSDSNTCLQAQTEGTPKLTITSGATCLTPGDTLIIKTGLYAEQLTDEIPGGTSWDIPVTVRAATGELVAIQPGAGQDGGIYFTNAQSKYIILDRINLNGTGETNGHGVLINGAAHHIRLQNPEIRDFWYHGILVAGELAVGNEFLNLMVHDNGIRPDQSSLNHGIYVETDTNRIEQSTVCNHTGHGINVFSANVPQPDTNVISRNTVYNNTVGIGSYGGTTNSLRNNIVYDTISAGIQTTGTNTEVVFNTISNSTGVGGYAQSGSGQSWRNNIFAESGDWGLWLNSGVTSLTVENNLFHNNTDGTIDNDAGATLIGTVTADPLFVDVPLRDFHIQESSPAIAAAIMVPTVTEDFDGDVRPQGVSQDIGADEFILLTAPSGLRLVGMRSVSGSGSIQ